MHLAAIAAPLNMLQTQLHRRVSRLPLKSFCIHSQLIFQYILSGISKCTFNGNITAKKEITIK